MNIRKRLATAGLIAVGVGSALTVPSIVDPAPAHAYSYYGAIALSPSTGQTGRAWDYDNSRDAANVAMSYCSYSDCKVVTEFVNGCGAIAKGTSYWGYGWASNLYDAESYARYYSEGGYIYDWVCTSGHS
ncbi:DUF4189 domain-containing protein [Gordonia sp. PDNC005]|uniref:DUF4189 domain-containing protein n=1 Tax=unclassified Gordonia (in: high G+C Gram-positive bacteria) TaxID=2657482 RepID=UPI001962CF8B|nr:DUF4189 domain-containing protein [Gordonia sp. PDNC005]QRY63677.1 DUF4189 domain-containing protein [Gordonia sp. PDNC005]